MISWGMQTIDDEDNSPPSPAHPCPPPPHPRPYWSIHSQTAAHCFAKHETKMIFVFNVASVANLTIGIESPESVCAKYAITDDHRMRRWYTIDMAIGR